MLPHLVNAIQSYGEAVRRREIQPTCNRCPNCSGEPDRFRYRGHRERVFLVIVRRLVEPVLSLLSRWKCPLCKRSFTLYPPFALPGKRYVRDCVFDHARRYLQIDELSYREAVKVEHMPVFHEGDDRGAIDERSLAHSTLHRWLSFFRSLNATLLEALRLIRERSARSDIFRKVFAVRPAKYRSESRRDTLVAALRALSIDQVFRSLFGRSIFPDLATSAAWA